MTTPPLPTLPQFNGGSFTDQQANGLVAGITYALSPANAILMLTSAQLLATSTITAISFTSAERNLGIMWTSGTNVNIIDSGTYVVTWGGTWQTSGVGRRSLFPLRNGSFVNQASTPATDAANGILLTGADTLYCNAGDVLTLNGFQVSGGNLNLTAARFGVTRISG